ncbi:MAG TPA: sigma-70 family RNA polymerase sigma factor [Nitrospiria bacterium]|jgi:RNA polymerase sigma-70 factor (ECF subfamily)|nr:sigma-70 family RNA polymerase sigma factor [Nitrospiria bacterium]
MDHEEKNDGEWVRRVQQGETEAFEVLVRRHEKRIFNLLYRWLGDYDEAAETAQEVFLSAYRSIRRFRGDSKFSTWLYRIAINHAKNRQKSLGASRRRTTPLDSGDSDGKDGAVADLPDPGPDPSQDAERMETHERVQHGLRDLDADGALLILLHDLQEVGYEEMARILDVPMGTVKSRLHRARQALKARLTPYFNARETQK